MTETETTASELADWCDLPGNTTEMMRRVSAELRRLEKELSIAQEVCRGAVSGAKTDMARIEEQDIELRRLKELNTALIIQQPIGGDPYKQQQARIEEMERGTKLTFGNLRYTLSRCIATIDQYSEGDDDA